MSDWKKRLEALENLPAEPLDKNAAWEKLYGRLDKKPRRKIAMIYWVAAASLLIAFLLIKFVNRPVDKSTPEILVKKEKEPVKQTVPEPNINIPGEYVIASQPSTKKSVALISKKQITNSNTAAIADSIIPDKTEPTDSLQIAVTTAEENLTPVSPNVVSPKKRMKMVHINELGNTPKEDVIMVQRQSSGNSYIRFNSNYNTFSPGSLSVPSGNNGTRLIFNPTN